MRWIGGCLLFVLWVFVFAVSTAAAREFERIPASRIERHTVRTEDGVEEMLIHLSNPGKPILLLEPGLGAQGLSLEFTAQRLWERGEYDIFVGNWRGSAKLPEGARALSGTRDGLAEVIRKDFPAHVRYLLNNYASPEQRAEGLRVMGHSMGGMMISGSLSDPRLAAELAPHIKGIVLLQSPHHVGYLQPYMKVIARTALPLLRALRASGVEAIELHSRLLRLSSSAKARGGLRGRLITPVIENFAIALTRLALSPAHTGREAWRRAFFKMAAERIPLDLLEDFARAVLDEGRFTDRDGRRLIQPERLPDIPIQVVRANLDTLAPWEEQGEYFDEIASPRKQLVNVHEMNHIDTVLFTRPEVDFLNPVLDFLANPAQAVARARVVTSKPVCESLLTAIKLKFRLRGI